MLPLSVYQYIMIFTDSNFIAYELILRISIYHSSNNILELDIFSMIVITFLHCYFFLRSFCFMVIIDKCKPRQKKDTLLAFKAYPYLVEFSKFSFD